MPKTPKAPRQNSLKPLHPVGASVYSAYWPEDDPNRLQTNPSWYPGVVSSYSIGKAPSDERYGNVRYYDVAFDDGDEADGVPDHFIMGAEEYLLHTRPRSYYAAKGEEEEEDVDDEENENDDHIAGRGDDGGGARDGEGNNNKRSWIGVRNVTDRNSKDLWARHVGWYVATMGRGGTKTEHTFSLLGDALRAYDAWVVRGKAGRKGGGGGGKGGSHHVAAVVRASELNLPGEWDRFLSSSNNARDCSPRGRRTRASTPTDADEGRDEASKPNIEESIREGIKEAQKKHQAELENLKKQLTEDRERTRASNREAEKKHQAELETLKKQLTEGWERTKASIREAAINEGRDEALAIIEESIREGIKEAERKHQAELETLRKQLTEDRERTRASIRETAIEEGIRTGIRRTQQKHWRELDQLKKRREAAETEVAAPKKIATMELERLEKRCEAAETEAAAPKKIPTTELERLEKRCEATEREAAASKKIAMTILERLKKRCEATESEAAAFKKIATTELKRLKERCEAAESEAVTSKRIATTEESERRRTSGVAKQKPVLEVGEEVYAAWRPYGDRKTAASWLPGRVKSHRTLKSASGDGGGGADGDGEDPADYGPVRTYTIEYDLDGSEWHDVLEDVPEHLVFPRADWNGVHTAVYHHRSGDKYAKLVGWFIAPIDGQEESGSVASSHVREFPKESRALLDAKANEQLQTEREQLGRKIREWCRVEGEEAVQQALRVVVGEFPKHCQTRLNAKANEQLRTEREQLERKIREECRVEREEAVQQALRGERTMKLRATLELRNQLRAHYKRENARGVKEAREDAREVVTGAEQEAGRERQLLVERLREELRKENSAANVESLTLFREVLARQYQKEKDEALAGLREAMELEFSKKLQNLKGAMSRQLQKALEERKAKPVNALEQLREAKESTLLDVLQQQPAGAPAPSKLESKGSSASASGQGWPVEGKSIVAGDQKTRTQAQNPELQSPPPAKRAKLGQGCDDVQMAPSGPTPTKDDSNLKDLSRPPSPIAFNWAVNGPVLKHQVDGEHRVWAEQECADVQIVASRSTPSEDDSSGIDSSNPSSFVTIGLTGDQSVPTDQALPGNGV